MDVQGEHRFEAPRDVVWRTLLDPEALRAALPGVEAFDLTAPDTYALTLGIGLAAIKGTYQGTVRVTDQQPPHSYRLAVDGQGKGGAVQGEATLTLTEVEGGTAVSYAGTVHSQGVIARMGSRLLGGAAKLMVGQFMKSMEQQIDARRAT